MSASASIMSRCQKNHKVCTPCQLFLARRQGFTLIEMLVVIAIISILAAMLSPSLQRALSSARAIACANNQKQVGYALMNYSNDYHGWIPGSQVYAKNGIPWSAMLTDITPRMHAPIAGNYCGDVQIFFCPDAYIPPKGYKGDNSWDSWRDTYGMNAITIWQTWQDSAAKSYTAYFDPNGGDRWIRLHAVPRPGNKPLVGDTVTNDGGAELAERRQHCEWEVDGMWYGHTLHARHAGRIGLWFADGHVAAVLDTDLGEKYNIKYSTTMNGDLMSWY